MGGLWFGKKILAFSSVFVMRYEVQPRKKNTRVRRTYVSQNTNKTHQSPVLGARESFFILKTHRF